MKLLIDNCLSPRLAPTLTPIFRDVEFVPLRDKFLPNTSDSHYFEVLGTEGGWAVLTLDNAIYYKPHQRAVWVNAGVTTFFLTSSWAGLLIEDNSWRYHKLMPGLLGAFKEARPGTGFSVNLNCGIHRLS